MDVSRRRFMVGTLGSLATAGCATAPGGRVTQGSGSPAAAPNVLFLSVDDMNDWTGFLGGHPDVRTPHMDRLAARGVVFERAYCPAPGCNQSRAATMTGRAPYKTGVYHNRQPFRMAPSGRDMVTLPQYLRRQGWYTTGAGKLYHGKFPDPASWTDFFPRRDLSATPNEVPPREVDGVIDPETGSFWPVFEWGAFATEGQFGQGTRQAKDYTTVAAVRMMIRQGLPEPFFLACGINLPHVPWFVPEAYFDLYDPAKITLPTVNPTDWDDLPTLGKRSYNRLKRAHAALMDAGKVRHAVAAYLAAITFTDELVGAVVDALDASPYAETTIIVLWSDHGYHLGEKTNWSKFTLWEEATRVPLLIVDPRRPAARCAAPVGLIDLYPTLCDLLGIPAPEGLDGRSLAPLLTDPTRGWDEPVITTNHRGNHALRNRRWRYIRYSDGGEELYDHAEDPLEWRNLARDPAFASAIEAMKAHLPAHDAPDAPRVKWPDERERFLEAAWAATGERRPVQL